METKKNILFITPYFYPARSYGWIPRVMYDLWVQLVQDWYNVECATTDVFDNDNRYDKKYEESNWIKIHFFKNISNKLVVKMKFPTPRWYKKWIKDNIQRFDVVHIADFRNLCSYYAYKYCKKYNIPYVVSPFWTVPYTKDYKNLVKKIFDKTWAKEMMKNAKYVTVQTNDEFEEVENFWVNKNHIKLIPLMVDYSKFEDSPEMWEIRKKYNISEKSKVLLFVWRIHEYKATDLMLKVFSKYHQKYNDSYLIIVGRDDWYKSKLKQLAKNLSIEWNVIFAWAVYYPDTKKYYVDSDIYFMAPSHFEQTSTASLEALACWTPAIVTKQADIPFIDKYEWAGFVLNYDEKDLFQWLIKQTELWKNSQNCINLIKNHFDVRAIKDEFLNSYWVK